MTSSAVTILLLIVVCQFGIGLCDVYHINISPNQPCPNDGDHCFTLPQFVNDFTNLSYGESKITLAFLPGNHTLPSQLLFQDYTMVSLFSQFDMSSNSTESVIICDGNGRFEFLHVLTVQVSQLTFIGCTGNNAKYVNQFLLEDSNFIGEQDKSGRALTLYLTSAVIIKSSFSHYDGDTYGTVWCQAHDYEWLEITATAGGAIFMRSSNATIELSRFEGNRATIGGAIYTSDSHTLTIINCTFVENNATIILPASHNINIITCYGYSYGYGYIFDYDVGGGALYARDIKNVTLIDSDFTNNHAQVNGGAVDISSSLETTVTITDSEFNGNRADHGGALINVVAGSFWNSFTVLTISQTNFSNNNALTGGVLYCVHCHKTKISNSEFVSNFAHQCGGVFSSNESVELLISNSSFIENRANGTGGVLCTTRRATVTSHNVQFINNSASKGGGVIYSTQYSNTTISNCNFTLNSVDRNGYGGVAYLQHGDVITQCEFD